MKNGILKYNDRVVYLLLLLLALFPLLPKAVESIVMISIAIISILFFVIEGKYEWSSQKSRTLLILSSLFFIASITLLYTKNFDFGMKSIQRLLPTLVFPLVFLFNKKTLLDKPKVDAIKFVYIGSILLFLLFLQIYFLKFPNLNAIEKRDLFEKVTKVHGTYFSLWIGFAVILLAFIFEELLQKKSKTALVIPIICIYFVYWQYTIGARMPFFATVLFLILHTFHKTKSWAIFILFIFGLALVLALNNDGLSKRVNNLTKYDFSFPKGQYSTNYMNITTEHVRNGIYYCSYNKIKEAPFLGYGIGDADDQLQECYDVNFIDTDTYKLISYNSHNEYINIILISGFVGFSIFVFSIFYLLKTSMNNKLYFSFLCFILLNFCFENVLSRQDGIIFFSFFNSLLYFQATGES